MDETKHEQVEVKQKQTPSWQTVPGYQPKPLFDLEKRDVIFAACGVAASICTAALGVFGGFAFGYLVSSVVMMTLFCVFFGKNCKLRVFPVVCGLLSLANSAVFVCTTNGSVRFFCVIVSLLLALVCFDGFLNGSTVGNRKTLEVFYRAGATVDNIDVSVKTLFSNRNGNKRAIGKVLIGLACAVPVLLVVVPLLVSSDDAFRGMMNNIFRDTRNSIFKVILGLGISTFVISYGLSLKTGRVAKLKDKQHAGIENIYIISFLSAIALCYCLYLFSQLAYFFSAFKGFLPDGEITYAQYARKGFFEMCVIAVINLVLVLVALLIARKKDGKVNCAVKALATFIGAFTMVIIATAISKMVLYIDAYGMTVLRVTTSAFMVFLCVLFICIILRIYMANINIVKVALLTAGCIVLALGTVNVNAICARYNYESYQSGKLDTIDVDALYDLGEEGIPYVVKLASGEDEAIAQKAKEYLAEAYLYDYFDNVQVDEQFAVEDLKGKEKTQGFERFSVPRAAAYKSLYAFLKENPNFAAECKEFYPSDYND